jgi:hypothetical protein
MKDQIQEGRRDFLKASAAGAAGLAISGASTGMAATSSSAGAWTDGMQVHPTINNLRVVCAHDARLANINTYNDDAVANELMDKLAVALAQKHTPDEAWASIFRKPASKTWAQVKVGLKAAFEGLSFTMFKMAKELNKLGVPYTNMYYFDCNTSGSSRIGASSTPPGNMPAGMNWSGNAGSAIDKLHGTIDTPVPFNGGTVQMKCCTDIANGTIDILVSPDYAGHDHGANFGGANLTCKNLYGVFDGWKSLNQLHGNGGAIPNDGLTGTLALQKSIAMLKDNNPPCLQLSFMNAIGGGVNRICMGTFSPIVDYLTFVKIRYPLLGKALNTAVWRRFYTEFGYKDADVAGLDFVDALAYDPTSAESVQAQEKYQVSLVVSDSAFKLSSADFNLYSTASIGMTVQIMDQRGRIVREFNPQIQRSSMISWDGRNQNGVRLPAGIYPVKVTNGTSHATGTISLISR